MATKLDDLRRFFPQSQFGDVQHIEVIKAGHSGAALYSVSATKGQFVLRLHGNDQAAWDKSVTVQRLASNHQIAPSLAYVVETERATVSVKVSGMNFGSALSQPSSRSAAFASLIHSLQKLHSISAPTIETLEPADFARSVWHEQSVRPAFPKWAAPLGQRISDLAMLIKPDTRKVLSHCDLNPANIIWDGQQIWLVDWEAAAMAHPYLDLATIANFLSLPDEPALGLLTKQEQAPIDDEQKAVFAALREIVRIAYGAVFLRLVPDLTAVIFRAHQETPALGECFAMMASGKYSASDPQWLAFVAAAMFKQCDVTLR